MKIKLGHIASIQTGLFAKTETAGDVVYLQVKDFDENGQIVSDMIPELKYKIAYEKHLLLKGDVLFASKGNNNFAALFDNQPKDCVASTTFFVIRLLKNNILPAFLVFYLNQANIQKLLKTNAIGTSISSISKAVLEDLDIIIPELEKQKIILQIAELRIKEQQLRQQIEILRDKQIQQQIFNAIK